MGGRVSIRIRVVDGVTIAVCAVETDPQPGDIYLDDAVHEALADKFASDWNMPWAVSRLPLMESVKVRDAREEILKWSAKMAIAAAANATFPREACGFLLESGTVVVCHNDAEDPVNTFRVPRDVADYWWQTGTVVGVWHSHCFAAAVPSEADEALAVAGVKTLIYSVPDEDLGVYRLEAGRLLLTEML